MILPSQTVTPDNTRAHGGPGRCGYCTAAIGAEHDVGCVCRKRTVILRTVVEYVVDVPEHWDIYQVEFHYNESSSCASNIFSFLAGRGVVDGGRCLCHCTKTEFVREATADDEDLWGYGIADLKSEQQG